jgi:hypothetical protein
MHLHRAPVARGSSRKLGGQPAAMPVRSFCAGLSDEPTHVVTRGHLVVAMSASTATLSPPQI